jgi:hypothetical protein
MPSLEFNRLRSTGQRRGVRRRSPLRRAFELMLGLGIAVGGIWLLRETPAHWKAMHEVWDQVEGQITASAVSDLRPSGLLGALRTRDHCTVLLDYHYRVGNEELAGVRMPAPRQPPGLQKNTRADAERIAASYQPGRPITVYYNPRAPRQTRLTAQGAGDLFGATFIFGSLMLLAGGTLLWLNCRELAH